MIVLESIINFDIGDIVIVNPDYHRYKRLKYEKIKRRLGVVTNIDGFTITVKWDEVRDEYKINYNNLRILKKQKEL